MKETPLFFFHEITIQTNRFLPPNYPKKRKQTKPIKINQPKVQKETEIENTSKKKTERNRKRNLDNKISKTLVKSKQNHFTHTERDVERDMPVMKEVASKLLGSSV